MDSGRRIDDGRFIAAGLSDAPGSGGFELNELFAVLRRHMAAIVVTILCVTGAAIAYVFTASPLYTAETMVVLDMRKTEVIASPAVLSGLPADSAVVLSEVELLRSPAFAEKVVRELSLDHDPAFVAEDAAGPIARAAGWVRAHFWAPARSQAAPTERERLLAAADEVRSHVTVTNDGRSYAITISYEDGDPARAAQIANAYAQIYVRDQLDAKSAALRKANAWMREQLSQLVDKVRSSARAAQVFRTEHGLTETRDGTVNQQQIMEMNARLSAARADVAQRAAALAEARRLARGGDAASVPSVVSSPLIQRLREMEASLIRRKADLASAYGPKHPAIMAIDDQLRDVRGKIRAETATVVAALSGELDAAKAHEAALSDGLRGLQRSAVQASDAAVRLQELQREAEADRALYQDLLLRSKQTAAQEDIQQPDAHIVGRAEPPIAPSHPRKMLLVGCALVVSAVLGVFLAFLADSLDDVFRSSEQLRRATGLPILGIVPYVRGGWSAATRAVVERPVSIFAEAIQNLRVGLRFNSGRDGIPKMIAVTSSVPGEGKTLVAASLARSLARSGHRTLLVDFDLRRPRVATVLNGSGAGTVDSGVPVGTNELSVREDLATGLHFLPAPRVERNPQEVLVSDVMRRFLDDARLVYEFVIIDTPPVLAVADALVVSRVVDGVVYVVRWSRTPQAAVRGGLELLHAHDAPVVGAVLSGVNLRSLARTGKGEWGYHYGAHSWLRRSVAKVDVY